MKTLKETIIDNLPWLITTLLAIGAFGATIKYHGEAIANTTSSLQLEHARIESIEKSMVRFEMVQGDIKEIKDDIKEIKKIIFKPIINDHSINKPSESLRSNNLAFKG